MAVSSCLDEARDAFTPAFKAITMPTHGGPCGRRHPLHVSRRGL